MAQLIAPIESGEEITMSQESIGRDIMMTGPVRRSNINTH